MLVLQIIRGSQFESGRSIQIEVDRASVTEVLIEDEKSIAVAHIYDQPLRVI